MEIIVAKNSGLCYGVKRALSIAENTRKDKKGNVFTFGDLIHNPQVISNLEREHIFSVDDIRDLKQDTVIIRSHGVSPEIYRLLKQKSTEIIDATCPIVKKIQKLVELLSKTEEEIIIVGSKKHPEIKGLTGYSSGKGLIVENQEQAKRLPRKRKRSVLAQSTQDMFLFTEIIATLVKKTEELQVYNTICQSTQTRQKSTSELASCVDTLFIIGGKNSSNSFKLYQISKRVLPNTYFIENSEQITPYMLKGSKKIGLSGGASTPPEAIQEAVAKIKSSFKHHFQREKSVQCPS